MKSRKMKDGDGRMLKPVTGLRSLSHTQFSIALPAEAPAATPAAAVERHVYTVEVNYFAMEYDASLYRDGRRILIAEMPAVFPVPGGVIEAASSSFGMKRVHFVGAGGEEQLKPAPGTSEYWRARLAHRHPAFSRFLGIAAVVVLLVSLALLLPQLLELVTSIPVVAERVGTFTSPIVLPPWLNTGITVAGFLAALERALTLRNHWLIDMDTWFFGD